MPRELNRLLKSYEFLKNSRADFDGRSLPGDGGDLDRSLNKLFVDILMHASDDPRVTLAQTRFLMTSLMDLTNDAEKGKVLRDACQRHLDRLQAHLGRQMGAATARPAPRVPAVAEAASAREQAPIVKAVATLQYRYLDSLSDRVALLDSRYRYVFTNTANARFHGKTVTDFIGKPNWMMVGESFFEKCNKPRFDVCFAGQPMSYIAPHPLGDPATLFAVNIDPVFDPSQNVESILVTCRDVSTLPIPPDYVTRP